MTGLNYRQLAVLFSFFALLLPNMATADETGSIKVTTDRILIGAQYDGIQLPVQGTIPADSDVIVRFVGAAGDLHLRQKGKVFGLLWMNVGKVTVQNAPKVCLIDSSRPYSDLGQAAASLRLEGLRDLIKVESGEGGNNAIDVPHELMFLKQYEGLYSEKAGGISLGNNEGDKRSFRGSISIPSRLAPGSYQVEALAIKTGQIVGRYTTTVQAELSGFPRWLSKLAFEKSLLFGILSTVIAIVSGLAIGLVFQSKGAH